LLFCGSGEIGESQLCAENGCTGGGELQHLAASEAIGCVCARLFSHRGNLRTIVHIPNH
jgi:DNA-binding transcriptional regulator LsrR (DeoR family)